MRKLDRELVETASLQLSPQLIRERRETENVRDLEADRKKFGEYLQDPTVRQSDMRVIAGRDRIIAAGERCWVTMVDCTDEEAEELELVENVHRRCDPEERAQQRRALLDLYERRLESESPPEKRGPGRPKLAKTKAREMLAEKEGVTPGAIEKMERRQEERESPAWGEEEPEELGPCIHGFGLDVPPTVNARAGRVQVAVDAMDGHLRQISALIGGLEESGLSRHDAQKARVEYDRLAHFLRGLRPQSVCPRCKARIKVADCLTCMGTGFATKTEMGKDHPPQLLQEGDSAQIQDERGAFRMLVAAEATAKKAPGQRSVVLVDDEGNETTVNPETGLPF